MSDAPAADTSAPPSEVVHARGPTRRPSRRYYDDLPDIEPNLLPVYDTLPVALDEALAD